MTLDQSDKGQLGFVQLHFFYEDHGAAHKGTMTLLYSSHNTEHNNVVPLREFLGRSRNPREVGIVSLLAVAGMNSIQVTPGYKRLCTDDIRTIFRSQRVG